MLDKLKDALLGKENTVEIERDGAKITVISRRSKKELEEIANESLDKFESWKNKQK